MTKDYADKVLDAVRWLRSCRKKAKKKQVRGNVRLGRSFDFGTRFCYKLAESIWKDSAYTVLVDDEIMLLNSRRKLRPDILLIKDKIIRAALEVKIDSWKGFSMNDLKNLREKYNFRKYQRVEHTKSKEVLRVAKSFKKGMIFLSNLKTGSSTMVLHKYGPLYLLFGITEDASLQVIKKNINNRKKIINQFFRGL